MPIYEYRCPNGHTFERFQPMSAAPPEKCDVCGATPLELVLYPIAIHYKGSGFYSTDYGRGKKSASAERAESAGESKSKDGDSKASETKKSDSDSKPSSGETKKAAEG